MPDRNPSPSTEFIVQISRAQRALYGFVFSLLRHAADADDVLQEANLVLWRKCGEFQPGTDFLAWAFRVAHFQVPRAAQAAAARALRGRHGVPSLPCCATSRQPT